MQKKKGSAMKVVVFGGNGRIGASAARMLRDAGHQVLAVSRSSGVDALENVRLDEALHGADAVVDAMNAVVYDEAEVVRFFETTTGNIMAAERAAGISHHVALSIIGVPQAPYGYYAGKARQEQLVQASAGGWTLLRAAQFHEFAAQTVERYRVGPLVVAPAMRSQPIAAAEVAAALAAIAEGAPRGVDRELAGPREESMPDMVRRYARATGLRVPVLTMPLPGGWGRAMRDGTLLGDPDARLGTQTFDAWLAERAR